MSRAEYVTLPLRDAPRLPPGELCIACGKYRFATLEAADWKIRRLQFVHADSNRVESRIYYDHGWWHITSQPEEHPGHRRQPSTPGRSST